VRFEYVKDAAVDSGLDFAAVDNVTTDTGVGPSTSERFNERLLGIPVGWTAGGTGGGWKIARKPAPVGAGRPQSHAYLGYQQLTSTSGMQRTMNFVAPATMTFRYYVDSEFGWDFLRVYVDDVKKFEVSGRDRQGLERIDVASGTHTFKFEYFKDRSVDDGLDTARVSEIVFRQGGSILEADVFDGQLTGSIPSQWSASGTHGGWVVTRPSPPHMFLDPVMQTTPITIDGVIAPEQAATNEYLNPTAITLPDYDSDRPAGHLTLRASRIDETLYIAYRAGAATPALGDELGSFLLGFDSKYMESYIGRGGCPGAPERPGPEDRIILVSYASSPGQASATIQAIFHYVGDCVQWQFASPPETWPITFAASENPDRPGWIDIEAKVSLRSSAAASDFWTVEMIGFVFAHVNTDVAGTRLASREVLPWSDIAQSAPWLDLRLWETLHVGDPQTAAGDFLTDGLPMNLADLR
jgi:hypothetical protein